MNSAPHDEESASGRLKKQLRRNHGGFWGLSRQALTNIDYLLGVTRKYTRPDLLRVDRLVFVCTGNLRRSAFAQAAAEKLGLHAASFGIEAATAAPAPPTAVRAAAGFGIALEGHRSTDMLLFRREPGDLYLVMESGHARMLERQGIPVEQIALLGYWSHPQRLHIHDPHRVGEDYQHTCFTLIHSAVLHLGQKLEMLGRAQRRPAPDAQTTLARPAGAFPTRHAPVDYLPS
jgi:protein-tyrosine phosphatase